MKHFIILALALLGFAACKKADKEVQISGRAVTVKGLAIPNTAFLVTRGIYTPAPGQVAHLVSFTTDSLGYFSFIIKQEPAGKVNLVNAADGKQGNYGSFMLYPAYQYNATDVIITGH